MKQIDWYFDFISPFAYLQHESLSCLQPLARITFKPVVFAGLLKHWGHLGPAEIPAKRQFTYRYITWAARKSDIPLRFPPYHPFNPIRALRLAIVGGNRPETVARIFRFIWQEGKVCDDEADFDLLANQLGITNPRERIADPAVKAVLVENGKEAIAKGLFGVPTFLAEGNLFWGNDATDMLVDYLQNPALFSQEAMTRVEHLPSGAERR